MAVPKPRAGTPWVPPDWELADASAIQALQRGDAGADQQVRALRFIVERLCATYDLSFQPESDRATAFAEGKRFVGLEIVKLTKVSVAALARAKSNT